MPLKSTKLAIFLLLLFTLCASMCAQTGVKFTIVHAFGSAPEAGGLWSGVVFDQSGNMYGSAGGGMYNKGAIWEIMPTGPGAWTETVLYSFQGGKNDGNGPTGIALGPSGVIYGGTLMGGLYNYGTAFTLTPSSGGWTENVTWNFNGNDGTPSIYGPVLVDKSGNVYDACGPICQLSPGSAGWTDKIICTVQICPADSITSGFGQILGTSSALGLNQAGFVFSLTPQKNGWLERTLYNFGGSQFDGQTPVNPPPAIDKNGNIFGATFSGGRNTCGNGGCGTIYELTRNADGHYTESILYNFQVPAAGTGYDPVGNVIVDNLGNIYGTTAYGGTGCACGVVYRLSPNTSGKWTYTVLHTFQDTDGVFPRANLTIGPDGNLYGTTQSGGPNRGGVVFQISRQ